MDKEILKIAYGGLLHDIGKFYQRTLVKSNLSEDEIKMTPNRNYGKYHTHLHSGYTSRFMKEQLNLNNAFEYDVSGHHLDTIDSLLARIVQKADHIASAVDRQDEEADNDVSNSKGHFISARLDSVLGEVDFGDDKQESKFKLKTLDQIYEPYIYSARDLDNKTIIQDSAQEYSDLFNAFVSEVNEGSLLKGEVSTFKFNRMYSLLNKYTTFIPASTYGGKQCHVSLFDHLKLTSAIASCMNNENIDMFYMLEIDVSGIQSFIYQVSEGESGKAGLTRALRGRSALVGIITNAIAYAYLKEFSLTNSNILFNTGGGAMLLLPHGNDVADKIQQLSDSLTKQLYEIFHTDITFITGLVELNAEELETFQSEKAMDLKANLGQNKMKKFHKIQDTNFFVEKVHNHECELCGESISDTQGKLCEICKIVEKVSRIYTSNHKFSIIYDYDQQFNDAEIDFGFVRIKFIEEQDINSFEYYDYENYYLDAINHFYAGNVKMIANLVPKENDNIMSFNEIANLIPEDKGDKKISILKMDVDNLGAIFAFGLKTLDKNYDVRKQRSISKYVTLSRLMENFFGHQLKQICKDVSSELGYPNTPEEGVFYINYAGGDDLAIIGPSHAIFYLAKTINDQFRKFTRNDNISISGGIQIQNPTRPIRFGMMEAEASLEKSKELDGKHGITIMSTTIPFDEYQEFLSETDTYISYINNGVISRTSLYNLMSNIRDCSKDQYTRLIPRIQYMLLRNIDKKYEDIRMKINTKVCDVEKNFESKYQKYVLTLKLAIMMTRD